MDKERRNLWRGVLLLAGGFLAVAALCFALQGGWEGDAPPAPSPTASAPAEPSPGVSAPAEPSLTPDPAPTGTVEETPQPSVEIIQRAEGTYEQWLAAGAVVAVSMQYPDFTLDGIYLTGETDLADKLESGGVYVLFTAEGVQRGVHASPLEGERTQPGTVDLYTRDLGFAAFEPVSPEEVDRPACLEITLSDLEELIAQSLLVSLYEH